MPWGNNKELSDRKIRRLAQASTPGVVAYLDELEASRWEEVQTIEREGAEAAAMFNSPDLPGIVQDLLTLCSNDIGVVMEALGAWPQHVDEHLEDEVSDGGTDRIGEAILLHISIGIDGIGNLFGYLPDTSSAYDSDLAAEGRRRGWRT